MVSFEINSVSDAFTCLIRMIEQQIDDVRESTSRHLNAGKYDKVKESIDLMEALVEYKDSLQEIRSQYPKPGQRGKSKPKRNQRRRRSVERPMPGQTTSPSAFLDPILSILREEGGTAGPAIIMPQLESKMKEFLKASDFERLPASNKPRWVVAVRNARSELIEKGLLKENSPRGLWELSEKGWEAIEKKNPNAVLKVMDVRKKSDDRKVVSKSPVKSKRQDQR